VLFGLGCELHVEERAGEVLRDLAMGEEDVFGIRTGTDISGVEAMAQERKFADGWGGGGWLSCRNQA
jgi:hypothetical protein